MWVTEIGGFSPVLWFFWLPCKEIIASCHCNRQSHFPGHSIVPHWTEAVRPNKSSLALFVSTGGAAW